jgi:hypothetical protein
MNLLSTIALFMLIPVGYASGVTAGTRWKSVKPTILDLVMVLLLWVGAFFFRNTLGHLLSILVWLLIGFVLGWTLARTRYGALKAGEIPTIDEEASIWRRVWQKWVLFAEEMSNFQSRMLISYFYFSIVLPFGLIAQLGDDPLQIKDQNNLSEWQSKENRSTTMEEVGRQG